MSVTNSEAPQGPGEERAFAKPKKHKTNALITFFLDSSQAVTQLTTQQAAGVEAVCRHHRRPSPSIYPLQSYCPGKMDPGFQPSRGNPEPPCRARQTAEGMRPALPEHAQAGLQKETRAQPQLEGQTQGEQQEARRPLATSSLPSSTRAGTYLRSEHLVPSLKSLFKAQGLKTRKVRHSVDLWPSHMALL